MCWQSQLTINRRPRRHQERTQREMGRAMVNREQIVLVVSDDAALCAAARREFEASIAGLRVASVTSVAAARRVELSALIEAGAADYVMRDGGCLPSALGLIRSRLRQAQSVADSARDSFEEAQEDFGEVLRHELNNPLTGILGNAELLLSEVHRNHDGKLPHGGEQRLETIAALAVRLRETVSRLSQEWEARQHAVH